MTFSPRHSHTYTRTQRTGNHAAWRGGGENACWAQLATARGGPAHTTRESRVPIAPESGAVPERWRRVRGFRCGRTPGNRKNLSVTATADDGAGPAAATGRKGSAPLEPIRRDRSRDVRHKWNCFNSQAARRGIVQQLTWEQFSTLVQKPCTYCGGGANEQSAALVGIDRIDSAVRRYALANCVCDVQLHEGAPSFCGVFGQD